MITIKDIANAAGVSHATVSRVINNGPKVGDETRKRVKQVMQELGYRPNANARALVTQKHSALGVVVAELLDPFFATLAHGIDSVARQQNIQLLMSAGSIEKDTELQAIDTLMQHRCEAMVVHSKALDDDTLIEFAGQIPGFVLINRYIPQIAHRCVWLDNTAGGKVMTQHLLDLGHRKFAVISSRYQIDDPSERLQGIRNTLHAAGLTLDDSHIEYSSPDQKGGEHAMRHLLARGVDFTAVLAYNDAMASGAMTTLSDHGLQVPTDASIVGFDDVLLAKYCHPKLTTLHYPIEMMAVKAAELALAYARGEPTSTTHTYKYTPTLVKRDSAAQVHPR
ncbi:LacI family DNA-binding transcriptional regulator [Gilvimarinus sp. SDUM040013]|uniref:LacI family DNA-binding transcriptional regulator n=1 Tax=Gilvimarinus gilvus TaxID=3058038 RepID=A0ABU4S1Q8_9GAMM|nr:LacI family DNA-binding transcriptional regulator [Gilvimarinus sp. SDUM040013]MDO3384751.1 LacI family DNA-binding transcriptional regulator [Gilvimarinus sp. SDUM040013]MDX6850431.1 LacI family DNA-binding transcriptional regulator [Gilvimarinus sp. SDUM040013]